MCDLANTDTHNWSKDKDSVTVECSATTGTGMSLCISKVQRSLWGRKRKIIRVRKLGKKQDLLGRIRLLHPRARPVQHLISQNVSMEGRRAQKIPRLNKEPLAVNGF